MIKTLIVDDEQHAIDDVVTLLNQYRDFIICGTAKRLDDAVELTKTLKPDLVFLDIVLGQNTGFDYLKIFKNSIDFNIIFLTAYNEFAVRAFDFSALHYLLKPIDENKFDEALKRMNKAVLQQEQLQALEYNLIDASLDNFIIINSTEKVHKINTRDISFIQATDNYTIFHSVKNTKITASKTLGFYEKRLNPNHFFRTHKSNIVNLLKVQNVNKKTNLITMENGTFLPIAARRKKDFFTALQKLEKPIKD